MNTIDKQYTDLLQDILDNGITKQDRTGTGTISVFGRQIRHKMSEGFPLLTTKKMPFKTIATELLWFLRGDTNIKFLIDNNCHIWDGDAYKRYHTVMNSDEWIEKWVEHGKERDEARNNKGNNGYTKEEFIHEIKTDDEFAKMWGDLGPIYGAQWRSWGEIEHDFYGIDQIAILINDLKKNPDSRRLMVNAWNPDDLPNMVLPPCHYGFQVYTRELTFDERKALVKPIPNLFTHEDCDVLNLPKRSISLMWNQRSVDTPLGLPFNIASYGLLLEIIAKSVNMVPDELVGNLGDCHIYLDQVDGVKEQITRHSFTLPILNINTEFWPTESGECGNGPIDAQLVFNGFSNEHFCKCLLEEDLQLSNYQSHTTIKFPLSN